MGHCRVIIHPEQLMSGNPEMCVLLKVDIMMKLMIIKKINEKKNIKTKNYF